MLDIAEHARHRPHAQRLRKRRGRRLRAIKPSRAAHVWYLNRLSDLVNKCRRIITQELKRLPEMRGVMDATPYANAIRNIREAFNGLKKEARGLANAASKRALFWVDDRLAKEVARSIRIDIRPALSTHGAVMTRFQEMTNWNVHLIQSIPDRMLVGLEEKLITAWSSGDRVKGITEIVEDVANDADVNAKRIARDQINKMNAAFNQTRQREVGIRRYIWQTAGNERVRGNPGGYYPNAESNHYELDGQEFSWDEPGPCRGSIDGAPCYPGQDIQCNCTAIPVFDLDALEAEVAQAESEQS